MSRKIFTLLGCMIFLFMLTAKGSNPESNRTNKDVVKSTKNTSNELFITGNPQVTMEVYRASNISTDGKYLVGYSNLGAFIWDIENSSSDNYVIDFISDPFYGDAIDITNDRTVVGTLMDDNTGLALPAVWKDNSWTMLGMGLITPTPGRTDVPEVKSITNDGKMVAGSSYVGTSYQLVPYVWTTDDGATWEGSAWEPLEGKGAKITSISKDGSTAVGWVLDSVNNRKQAAIFKSSTEYKIIDGDPYIAKEFNKISDNGKYVAMTTNGAAAVYNVEKDEIFIIKNNAVCMDVSDNGIAIGYYNVTANPSNSPRKGFVWSEEMGYVDFLNFLTTFVPDVTLPADLDFDPAKQSLDVPTTISPDGKIISGWSGLIQLMPRTFVLKMGSDVVLFLRPTNFTAKVNLYARTKVDLTWEAPESEAENVIGYKIYRNGNSIAQVGGDVLSYEDDVTADYEGGGKIDYCVSAIFEGDIESLKTNNITVRIISNYNIPFNEDFESKNLETNGWTLDPERAMGGLWFIDNLFPQGYKDFGLSYWGIINNSGHSESVVSKPFDATSLESVYMSYIAAIFPDEIVTTATDTLYIELCSDIRTNEWKILKTYPLESPEDAITSGWFFDEFDLSEDVAGQIFQVRFRVSGKTTKSIFVEVDNFQVRATKEVEQAPFGLKAQQIDESNIELTWNTPTNSSYLTYIDGSPYQTIGNEGKSFIGANLFDTTSIEEYKDKYLTSVYAFFPETNATPATYKLAIFEGSERISSQIISIVSPLEWNAIHLDTPVKIKEDKPLYIGIEVVTHSTDDLPLYTGKTTMDQDGLGNLFSEDGGVTWQKLSDFGLNYAWCIIGNITESNTQFDNYTTIWGYEVLRDGVKISDPIMINSLRFIDEVGEADTSRGYCYTVKAYYPESAWSAPSEEACVTMVSIENNYKISGLTVYPNPVADEFKIDGFEGDASMSLIDISGKTVLTKKVRAGEAVSITNLQTGLYLVKLTFADNSKKVTRLLKK